MQGFFDLQPDTPAAREDFRRAEKLKTFIPKTNLRTKISITKWATEFEKLRETDDVDAQDIDLALDWLSKNFDKDYTPRLFSASGFRRKFRAIQAAMQRDPDAGIVITDQCKKLVLRDMVYWNWPKGAQDQLHETVQRSMNAYVDFRARVLNLLGQARSHRLRIGRDKQKALANFIPQVLSKLMSVDTFVENWMHAVHRMVWRWDDWSGDLVALSFKPNSKKFYGMGCDWALEWCGDHKRWQLLMEQLKHASRT